jgi:catechol 2,3-dioxygenase-like lactoylglutathione lyase family enzyme
MRRRLDVLTLGVSDVERSLAFYRRLGLESEGPTGTQYEGDETTPGGTVAMFHLEGGLTLALYGRSDLAKDANVPLPEPQSGEFSIGHLVSSKDEVDALLAAAVAAGATLTDEPHDRPWGIYSGYFRDLDGHLWEVIWSPRASTPTD